MSAVPFIQNPKTSSCGLRFLALIEEKGLARYYSVCLVLVPLVYAVILSFSLTNERFWADDGRQLAFVRDAPSFLSLLGADSFHLFRPVKNLLWLVFSKIEPSGMKGCRLVSIGIGIVSFFPVLGLCRRIFEGNRWKALVAATMWLLSPTLVSSAAWLSCVNIQIMAALAVMTVLFHDSAWDGGMFRPGRIIAAGVCFFLSLVSYECAVAIVPILVAFDFLLRTGRPKEVRARFSYMFYIVVLTGYFLLRQIAQAKEHFANSWADAERWQLALTSPFFTTQHLLSWFWPFGRFTVMGGYQWGDVAPCALAVCWVFGIAVLAFATAGWRRRPILSFCLFFSLFGFAPVSNCLGFGNGPYGDYYLTLASIGLAAGCTEILWALARVHGVWRKPMLALLGLFVFSRLAAIPEAAKWAWLWGRSEAAFEESVLHFPKAVSNKIVFIQCLSDHGQYDAALEIGRQIEESVGPDSAKMSSVYLVRGLYSLNVLNDAATSLSLFDRSAAVCPPEAQPKIFHYYRGCVFDDLLGDEQTAASEYEAALEGGWDMDAIPCADRLARLKAIRGELGNAILLWEKALRLDPDNAAVAWNLSTAYRNTGEIEKSDVLRKRANVSPRKGSP